MRKKVDDFKRILLWIQEIMVKRKIKRRRRKISFNWNRSCTIEKESAKKI